MTGWHEHLGWNLDVVDPVLNPHYAGDFFAHMKDPSKALEEVALIYAAPSRPARLPWPPAELVWDPSMRDWLGQNADEEFGAFLQALPPAQPDYREYAGHRWYVDKIANMITVWKDDYRQSFLITEKEFSTLCSGSFNNLYDRILKGETPPDPVPEKH